MIITSPENIVLVEIEKRFQDKTGNIVIDPTWHPEDHATMEGIVYSAPHRLLSDNHRTIVGTVKRGDKIVFSYSVIFAKALQNDNENPVYKNLIIHQGKELWKAHAGEIFCKIVDGEIIMLTDNVLTEPMVIEESKQTSRLILDKPKQREDIARIIGLPENKELSYTMRDLVSFESKYVQKYQIQGRQMFLIPSRRILAKIA